MKTIITYPLIALLLTAGVALKAQENEEDRLGLPGDNLNLYAVMNLFQASKTLEDFERGLNDPETKVNNLDLNGDNYVDYLTVNDEVNDNVHTIIIQDALSPSERQDVAVFTVQRLTDGSVQIQLIGDEDLYGRNYIIEPIYDDAGETPNPGYVANAGTRNVTVVRTTTVEVAAWPVVRFIFLPEYVIWRSAWYWNHYPSFWHPWNPYYWHYYYGYHYHWYPEYYRHYRHWHTYRYPGYHAVYYTSHRAHAPVVVTRIKDGAYRSTYSHPEQRRDGESLYRKSHPDRPVTESHGSSRRSNVTETKGSGTMHRSDGNTGTVRRESTSTEVKVRKTDVEVKSNNDAAGKARRTGDATNSGSRIRSSGKSSSTAGTVHRSSTTVSKKEIKVQKSDKSKKSESKDSGRRK